MVKMIYQKIELIVVRRQVFAVAGRVGRRRRRRRDARHRRVFASGRREAAANGRAPVQERHERVLHPDAVVLAPLALSLADSEWTEDEKTMEL